MSNLMKRIIKLIISLNVFLYDRVCDLLFGPIKERTGTCVIFYYHAVNPSERKSFAGQLDDLERWTRPISINDIDKIRPGDRCSSITFDDGFASVLDNALPELAKRNIPAALFIPSGCLGKRSPWLDEGSKDYKNVIMTGAQLNGLDKKLFCIGSHCRTHTNLLKIKKEEANKEIVQSKRDLEDILNVPVNTISFPHGEFDQYHIDIAVGAGYRQGFSILPAPVYPGADSFVRGRVKADPSDWRLEFRLKLFGAYRWLSKAFALKKKLYQRIFRYEYRPAANLINSSPP